MNWPIFHILLRTCLIVRSAGRAGTENDLATFDKFANTEVHLQDLPGRRGLRAERRGRRWRALRLRPLERPAPRNSALENELTKFGKCSTSILILTIFDNLFGK